MIPLFYWTHLCVVALEQEVVSVWQLLSSCLDGIVFQLYIETIMHQIG